MTLSREADQLLPPRMTPFTGLFQRPQCDPEPMTFPVHSQSPSDTPLIKRSLLSPSAPPYRAPERRCLHCVEFLPHKGHQAASGSTSLLCQLWASVQSMAVVRKVMANPKIQGIAGPAEPRMCRKEQLKRVVSAQMCLGKMGGNERFPDSVTVGKAAVGTWRSHRVMKERPRRGKADGISPSLLSEEAGEG